VALLPRSAEIQPPFHRFSDWTSPKANHPTPSTHNTDWRPLEGAQVRERVEPRATGRHPPWGDRPGCSMLRSLGPCFAFRPRPALQGRSLSSAGHPLSIENLERGPPLRKTAPSSAPAATP